MTVVEMIARNARMYPADTALIELRPSQKLRKQFAWNDFDDRINRAADALIQRGVKKGDRVLHWLINSINWVEAYFGIMRSSLRIPNILLDITSVPVYTIS